MRYIDRTAYYTVSEVADAAGVSAQTIRAWERAGHLHSRRSPGGHRLFDVQAMQTAKQRVASQRRASAVERVHITDIDPGITDREWASTGARIRAARERTGLTQAAAAELAGISRSLLSAVERGDSGISLQAFSRIAETLGLALRDLAPTPSNQSRIMRRSERLRTVLAGGVTWEELVAPGYRLSPATLTVPEHSGSGGAVTLPDENFVMMIEGMLAFKVAQHEGELLLHPGETLMVLPGETHSWHNPGPGTAKAFWVELTA